jgi:hypothetical protein
MLTLKKSSPVPKMVLNKLCLKNGAQMEEVTEETKGQWLIGIVCVRNVTGNYQFFKPVC